MDRKSKIIDELARSYMKTAVQLAAQTAEITDPPHRAFMESVNRVLIQELQELVTGYINHVRELPD